MGPTTPLEVVFLDVVFATVLAHLLFNVELALLLFKLLDTFTHLFSLLQQILPLSFELHFRFITLIGFLSFRLQVPVELKQLLLKCLKGQCFLSLNLVFLGYQLLGVFTIGIPLLKSFLAFYGEHLVLFVLPINVVSRDSDFYIEFVFEIFRV